jgi:hypothetical protein
VRTNAGDWQPAHTKSALATPPHDNLPQGQPEEASGREQT